MALDLGELVGYIKLDHKGVGQGIAAAQADMRAGMNRMQSDAGRQGKAVGEQAGSGLVGAFKGQVGKLTGIAAGAFAVDKILKGFAAARDAASDLNETTSMSAAIFGQNQRAMLAFAKEGPRALGLSTEATLRQSAAFGDMFLQLGFAENKAASMSQAVLQMAADLGSFKNLRTEDVVDRISAGFRGEYDSLQLLIPNISAARVQSEAMAATGKKNADSLTAQEKAAATLAIVQKDGARAMGDFARTSGGYANASKTAAAETEDLKAKIGQGLLPAYITLITYGRDQVLPFLSATVDHLGAVGDAVAPAAHGIADLVGVFRGLPPEVQAATVGLLTFLALRSRLEDFGTGVKASLGGAATATGTAIDTMRLHLMYAADTAAGSEGRFTGVAKAIGQTAGAGIRGAATGLLGILGGPWGIAFAAGAAAVSVWAKAHAEAKARVEALTSAVESDSGAIGKNTRETIANALEKSGAAKAARELGINLGDLANAATGQADAQKRVNDQLERATAVSAEAASSGGDLTAQYGDVWAAAKRVREALGSSNDELNAAKDAAKRHSELMGDDASATISAADAASGLASASGDAAGSLDDQATAAKKAAQAVLDLADAQLKASGAQISYEDALAGVQERLDKRKELEAELAKAGGSSDRTKNLQEKVDGGPSDRTRHLQRDLAATSDAKKQASLRRQLADSQEADAKRLSKAESDLADSRSKDAQKNSDDIARIRKELAQYTAGVDLTTEAGRENQKTLNDLADAARSKSKADAEAGVSLKDLRANMAQARTDFIDSAVKLGVSKKAAEAMATQFGLTKTDVDNLARSVDDLPASKQIRIEAETAAAAAAIALLKKQIDGLKNTNVVVTAEGRFVNTGTLANGGKNMAGGSTKNEDGGYYGPGTPRIFGSGEGIKHVFNEPAAGGESFIPHSPGKRKQAMAVLGQTAGLFGFNLAPKSSTRISKVSVLHTGNVIANDPGSYVDQAAAMEKLQATQNDMRF